jgi:RNA polymerase sigma factor (TIGR02999 family)
MGANARPPSGGESVTALLAAWHGGDRAAFDRLVALLYAELRRLAAGQLAGRRGHTLQPTALVHEAFMRLVGWQRVDWQGRAHFLAAAAKTMRYVLIDHARSQAAAKRGGDCTRVTLGDAAGNASSELDVLALDLALEKLTRRDPDKARVVELRYFGGLTIEESAEVLSVAPATVKRHWSFAKAWLARELGGAVGN